MSKTRSAKTGKYVDKTEAELNPDSTVSEKPSVRYFFDQDDDCHWYLIPETLRSEWNRLGEIEDSWELPEWQKFEDCRIDGISGYSFENPREK